jgi:hypothetical protein
MQVSCRIHESKTEQIKLGLPATVVVEGITGVQFTGTVTKISALADSRSRWLNPDLKEYTTEVTLDQTHPSLRPGGTATCYITVTHLDDVLAVPVQAVFARGAKRFVFVGDGGSPEPVEVKLGQTGAEYVVVKSGLEIGQEILLAIDDELMSKLPSGGGQNGVENASYATAEVNADETASASTQPTEKPADSSESAEPATVAETSEQEQPGADGEVANASDTDTVEPAEPSADVESSTVQTESPAEEPTSQPAATAEAATAS